MSPADLGSDISSSTKLWATASKEWVIQPKPKPGRRPKKDNSNNSDDAFTAENKGRRVQNRAAQRAFRERKQSQLAELQARIQSYEQGEIERNVALQNIAKRLRDENEGLRVENTLLKEKLVKFGHPPETSSETGKKRSRPASPSFHSTNDNSKKPKVPQSAPTEEPVPLFSPYLPSPPSMASPPSPDGSPESHESPFSSDPSANANEPTIGHVLGFANDARFSHLESNEITFGCGFCTEGTPCVCSDFIAQPILVPDRLPDYRLSTGYSSTKNNGFLLSGSTSTEPAMDQARPSILEHLPAFQPAVPLRRRRTNSGANSIFPVRLPPKLLAIAACSGDPSNCLACADDSFGKAFCSAIRESVANETPCSPECATNTDHPSNACLRDCCSGKAIPFDKRLNPANTDTIPTNDAWRQIKNHPNVSFADLALLADVVSRKSKCTGPRVVISPVPGSFTPERTVSPSQLTKQTSEDDAVLLADPHGKYRESKARSVSLASPTPIPKEDWIRQRVCEVQKDAVENALHLLDSKFA